MAWTKKRRKQYMQKYRQRNKETLKAKQDAKRNEQAKKDRTIAERMAEIIQHGGIPRK